MDHSCNSTHYDHIRVCRWVTSKSGWVRLSGLWPSALVLRQQASFATLFSACGLFYCIPFVSMDPNIRLLKHTTLASRLWLFLCGFTLARKGSLLLYVLWCLIPSHLPLACTGSGALANVMMQWQDFTGWAPLAAAGVISVLSIMAVSSAFNENVGNSSSSIWRPLVQSVQSLHGVNSFWLALSHWWLVIFSNTEKCWKHLSPIKGMEPWLRIPILLSRYLAFWAKVDFWILWHGCQGMLSVENCWTM